MSQLTKLALRINMMKLTRTFLAILLSSTMTIGNATAGRWLGSCFQPIATCCVETECYSPCEVMPWCQTSVSYYPTHCQPVDCCPVDNHSADCCHETVSHDTGCSSCHECDSCGGVVATSSDCDCEHGSTPVQSSHNESTMLDSVPSKTVYSEIAPQPTPAPVMEVAPAMETPEPVLETEGFSSAPTVAEPAEPFMMEPEVEELSAPPEPMFSDVEEEPMAEEPASFNEEDAFGGGLFDDELMVEEPMAEESSDDLFGNDGFADEAEPMFEEEPAVEAPVAEESFDDSFDDGGLFGDEPMADEPVADEPAAEQEATDDLFGDDGFSDDGFSDDGFAAEPEPMVEEPMAAEEPSDDLFGDDSFGDEADPLFEEEPAMEAPAAEESFDDSFDEGGLFGEEPMADEPMAEEPAAEDAAGDLFGDGGFEDESFEEDAFDGGAFEETPMDEPAQPAAVEEVEEDLFGGFDDEPMFEEAPATETPADAFPANETPATDEDLEAVDDLFGDFGAILNEPGGYQSAGARNWVDNTGSFSCVGRLVSVDGNQVKLAIQDGSTATVPMARLSQGDLEFVNRQALAYYEVELVRMAQR